MQSGRLWNMTCRFMSSAARKADNPAVLNQQIKDEFMIPGPYLRYFKTPRGKKRDLIDDMSSSSPSSSPVVAFDKVHRESARSIHDNDSAPTFAQQQLAHRIQRGLNNVYSYETLPNRWLAPSNLAIHSVKVARNLRKCQIYYEPLGSKDERGHVHRALQKHASRLESMIRHHAGLRRPITVKFVSDTQTNALESIFEKIASEKPQDP